MSIQTGTGIGKKNHHYKQVKTVAKQALNKIGASRYSRAQSVELCPAGL